MEKALAEKQEQFAQAQVRLPPAEGVDFWRRRAEMAEDCATLAERQERSGKAMQNTLQNKIFELEADLGKSRGEGAYEGFCTCQFGLVR